MIVTYFREQFHTHSLRFAQTQDPYFPSCLGVILDDRKKLLRKHVKKIFHDVEAQAGLNTSNK